MFFLLKYNAYANKELFDFETNGTFLSYSNMVILQSVLTEQTFSFIPRSQIYDSMFVKNEATGEEVEIPIITFLNGDYYDTISAIFSVGTFLLIENNFYTLELRDGINVSHYDRIFCTNQNPVINYSVNKDDYKTNISNNEFIIYE
jgi:hypothetical protein